MWSRRAQKSMLPADLTTYNEMHLLQLNVILLFSMEKKWQVRWAVVYSSSEQEGWKKSWCVWGTGGFRGVRRQQSLAPFRTYFKVLTFFNTRQGSVYFCCVLRLPGGLNSVVCVCVILSVRMISKVSFKEKQPPVTQLCRSFSSKNTFSI